MLVHRENKQYVQWSLENTAEMLTAQFPECHIWVVKPNTMFLKTFSCYSSFVNSSICGVPEHSKDQHSWHTLFKLMTASCKKLTKKYVPKRFNGCKRLDQTESQQCDVATSENDHTVAFHADINLPVKIVGFSKGCVVLNQLLYDLDEGLNDIGAVSDFVQKVTQMIWLDGGHAGHEQTWITSQDVLCALKKTSIQVSVRVTPYQICDEMRPWIRIEETKFVKTLMQLGLDVDEKHFFTNNERTLNSHFHVLMHINDKDANCLICT